MIEITRNGSSEGRAHVEVSEGLGLVGGVVGIMTGVLSIRVHVRQGRLDRFQQELQNALRVRPEHVDAVAPPMPVSVEGFEQIGDVEKTNLRLFGGGTPFAVPDFPVTMNGCAGRVWTLRWRSLGGGPIFVYKSWFDFDPANVADIAQLRAATPVAHGHAGRLDGHGCDQPVFVSDPDVFGPSDLADLVIEVQHWEAAP